MSDVAQEAMDSSVGSEEDVEDQQETLLEDETSPKKRPSKISAVGEIIEGKRAKKTVERLDLQAPKTKEKLKIGDGSGDKLGDIPRTNRLISRMKSEDLKKLHMLLFDRPGKNATLRKNLRLFNGFPFDVDSEQYNKKREKLLKNTSFTNTKLKVVCTVLDLEKKGTHTDLIDRILTFLISPKNSGKPVPVKKRRKSKKKLSGDDSKVKTKKSKPKARSSSSSPKKSKAGSKSKAIVMDSSSDDEEDEKAGASAEAEGSDGEEKQSEREEEEEKEEEEEHSDVSEESSEEEEKSEESSKLKSDRGQKKKAPAKRQRTPAKKTGPLKKRAKKETSEESDHSEAEKPKKKKPAAKTKKADSSSSNSKANAADDSSDEDEPLIRMIKKSPSDEQLKDTVQRILKNANLDEMTMKQICQRVFDTYPEHNLSTRKDFIKQTVKSLIT